MGESVSAGVLEGGRVWRCVRRGEGGRKRDYVRVGERKRVCKRGRNKKKNTKSIKFTSAMLSPSLVGQRNRTRNTVRYI